MTQQHFMEYVRFFLGTLNRLRKSDQVRMSLKRKSELEQLNKLIVELKKLRDSVA